MPQATTYRRLTDIEADMDKAIAAMESARDDDAAAKAFLKIKTTFQEYRHRSTELREEYYKQKTTITKQANLIAEREENPQGEPAPSAAPTPHITIESPEIIALQQSPDFFFIPTSYGFANVRHIVELDLQSQTLITTQGIRHLQSADAKVISYQLKLYRPS